MGRNKADYFLVEWISYVLIMSDYYVLGIRIINQLVNIFLWYSVDSKEIVICLHIHRTFAHVFNR